jgi:putative FmdB family regulatory protein
MALYDYRCKKCGEVFEVRQKFSDEPLTVHENCGGEVQRMVSAPALQFKGTGWYVTDYAKNGKSPSTSGKSESGKSEGKSETAKTETKSESKSETSKSEPAKSSSSTSSTDKK